MTDLYITNTERVTEGNETRLRIHGRDAEMNAHTVDVTGFNPYFYVPTAEVKALVDFERREHVVSVKHGYTSLFGDDVSRIEVTTTNATRELRELFSENFETDVWYENRALIDLELYTGIRVPDGEIEIAASAVEPVDFTTDFSVLTFDIETDDRGRFPKPGERPVLSIVGQDSESGEYRGFVWLGGRPVGEVLPGGLPEGLDALEYYETEVEMLAGFAQYVSDVNPDVLTAWNIGFDAPYILERMKKLSVDAARLARGGWAGMSKNGRAHIAGRVIYDMLDAYKSTKRGELPSYSLNAVAAEELGEEKLDHSGEGIYEMWESNVDKLLRYNFHDVRLVVALNDKLGIIEFRAALSNAVGADFGDAENNNDFIEMMVRRKLHEKGLIGPTTVYEKKEDQFKGGYVRDPYYGVAEHVVGMDLESLYPNTMWMLNASPECRVDPETFKGPFTQAPNGAAFRLDKIGVMTELVDEALSLKSEAKKKRNSATPDTAEYNRFSEEYDVRKTIVNSLFGVTGWEYFFLYDELTAESISTMGQEVIKFTSRYVEANSTGRVIYGDTDSNYVMFPDANNRVDALEEAYRLADELNETAYAELSVDYNMGTRDCRWRIEVESYSPRFFQYGKKKRYALHVTWKNGKKTDEIKKVGLHTNRSDVAPFTSELQTEVVEAILRDGDPATLNQMIYEAAESLSMVSPDWNAIGIPQGIKKPLDAYDRPTAQVVGAINSNRLLGTNFGENSKPKRVYLQPTYFAELDESIDVLCFDDPDVLPDGLRLNTNRMVDTLIVKPIGPVVEAVGVDIETAILNQYQTGLGSFL